MKILCQERYDKAIAYAKEIKNDTLQKCIDRLKQWEENPNCPCEIELYYDSAPHSFGKHPKKYNLTKMNATGTGEVSVAFIFA